VHRHPGVRCVQAPGEGPQGDFKATLAQIYRLADEGKLEDETVRLVGDDDDEDVSFLGPPFPRRPLRSSFVCLLGRRVSSFGSTAFNATPHSAKTKKPDSSCRPQDSDGVAAGTETLTGAEALLLPRTHRRAARGGGLSATAVSRVTGE
jgi:hypothetical protein